MGITFENVTYNYRNAAPPLQPALNHISLALNEGRFIAVLGETGSGKSTLLQHLNGILTPSGGSVRVLDFYIAPDSVPKRLKALRRRVGLVFQFPEHQLFEETVENDLMFGPKNFGATDEEAREAAIRAARCVGLDPSVLAQHPFRSSGGQMRKAAIAAVLAADPDIIALDEPTASLDPLSRAELMRMLRGLVTDQGKTVIVVTHRIEEVLPVADELIVMRGGEIAFQGSPGELRRSRQQLEGTGLAVPAGIRFMQSFIRRFGGDLPDDGSVPSSGSGSGSGSGSSLGSGSSPGFGPSPGFGSGLGSGLGAGSGSGGLGFGSGSGSGFSSCAGAGIEEIARMIKDRLSSGNDLGHSPPEADA